MNVDEEQDRRVVGGLPYALIDGAGAQRRIVRTELCLYLPELGRVEQVQAVHQAGLQREIARNRKTSKRARGGQRVPHGQPRSDRPHSN